MSNTERAQQQRRESAKRWRESHPEEQKAHSRKYYLKNREKRLVQMREYQRRIREKAKQYDKIASAEDQPVRDCAGIVSGSVDQEAKQ